MRFLVLVLTFASSVVLAAVAPSARSVQAEIINDGSLVIEGRHYVPGPALTLELQRLKEQHANLVLFFKRNKDHRVKFEVIGKMILLLQKAGWPKVGFVIGPDTTH